MIEKNIIINGSELFTFAFDTDAIQYAKDFLYKDTDLDNIPTILAEDLGRASFDGFNLIGTYNDTQVLMINKENIITMIEMGLQGII
jgi:hypothetical protein